MKMIYIYSDKGASQRSVLASKRALERWTPYASTVLTSSELLQGSWTHNALAILVPGGADLPYCQLLNGLGNSIIRQYVEQGGTYLGICAGAYFASSRCHFHLDDEQEINQPRELSFYPGPAIGPTLSHYDADSESGMRVADIMWHDGTIYPAYFNGGCHFGGKFEEASILGNYVNTPRRTPEYGQEPLPAIVKCFVGKGIAVLSGVHAEYTLANSTQGELFQLIISEAFNAQPE